jgi:hypothetical protein
LVWIVHLDARSPVKTTLYSLVLGVLACVAGLGARGQVIDNLKPTPEQITGFEGMALQNTRVRRALEAPDSRV